MALDLGQGINYGLLSQNNPSVSNRITQVDAETQPENYRANLAANTARQGQLTEAATQQGAQNVQAQGQLQNYNIAQQQQSLENKQFQLDTDKWGPEKAKQLQQMRFAE